ncbi:UNVERIFIED_CONTAM: hypothetical protein Sindi_0808100 [Sesamum indicum]
MKWTFWNWARVNCPIELGGLENVWYHFLGEVSVVCISMFSILGGAIFRVKASSSLGFIVSKGFRVDGSIHSLRGFRDQRRVFVSSGKKTGKNQIEKTKW